jgi:hypothetical protein
MKPVSRRLRLAFGPTPTPREVTAMNDDDNYPGKGSPWSDFLHHRARVIDVFTAEGKSPEEIAWVLSMDPGQVRLIYGRRRDPADTQGGR